MKQGAHKRNDIVVLLCVLLIFSGGISLIYGKSVAAEAVSAASDNEIIQAIQPLDISHSVKKMANVLSQKPFEQQMRIYNQVIENKKSSLSPEERVELGLELLAKRNLESEQKTILDVIVGYPSKVPMLYIAVDKKNLSVVPMIARYLGSNSDALQEQSYKALVHAIDQNNLVNFNQLIQSLGGISKDMATRLLWDVLNKNKDAQFIPYLTAQKADIDNAQNGKTPLIAAIEADNVEMVQMLLDKGAQVNKFVDPAIGTPLQRAFAMQKQLKTKSATTIELLLRNRGAKE